MMRKFFVLALLAPVFFFSQQSRTLQQCEEAFIKNNLLLIAQQYNIDVNDADIMQAKIWDLPQVSFQANLIDPNKPSFLNLGPSKSVGVQQLFLLGGKRKLEVEFAKSNKELAQLQFNQLLVDLKAQLRETFYSLYFDQKKIKNIDNQLGYMNDLLKAYRVQTAKGNISLKDQVRLNTIVLSLNNDRIQINNEIVALNQTMMTLTGDPQTIEPEISIEEERELLRSAPLQNLEELQQKALENNADYLFSLKAIENNRANYNLQKSMNIPDLTAGLQWNQAGGLYQNEINFGVGIPIPLWKRNEGNVKKAQMQIEQAQKNTDYKKLSLMNAVTSAYQTWENQYQMYERMPQKDIQDLETVYKGMTENFRRGNVTLIEFTDFMDSYKQATLQLFEIQKQILISAEELNRLTQTKTFN
ncbi:TolC family protein [Chryseobacterium suipulveris]|uniref:TolC family protein n=1 Tax=Chryseobacterium suipulveris TaxID=2929800 RepID=A0ABY4BR51_9FLAO|nr:TolC family protein [Chryseobacterium suipulveris]UOE41595.1 TolC family protein [Chryseobacterium suipulveris]